MPKKLKNANGYVRYFAGGKVTCMKDHIKPLLRERPYQICAYIT